jgi:hypothetical protein
LRLAFCFFVASNFCFDDITHKIILTDNLRLAFLSHDTFFERSDDETLCLLFLSRAKISVCVCMLTMLLYDSNKYNDWEIKDKK